MKIALPVLTLALVASLGFNIWQFKTNNLKIVTKVIDGDTLIIGPENYQVRLQNIDAPELSNCGGKEAYERLKFLVEGKKVKIESFERDRFNRPLVYVFVDSQSVNEILAKEGLVRYDGSPNKYRDAIQKANTVAIATKQGIFSKCVQDKPENSKCDIKGNVNENRQTKIYFLPTCQEYDKVVVQLDRGEQWFCSENEATEAGYTKAEHC